MFVHSTTVQIECPRQPERNGNTAGLMMRDSIHQISYCPIVSIVQESYIYGNSNRTCFCAGIPEVVVLQISAKHKHTTNIRTYYGDTTVVSGFPIYRNRPYADEGTTSQHQHPKPKHWCDCPVQSTFPLETTANNTNTTAATPKKTNVGVSFRVKATAI